MTLAGAGPARILTVPQTPGDPHRPVIRTACRRRMPTPRPQADAASRPRPGRRSARSPRRPGRKEPHCESLSGRLTAVLVAILATILLVGVIGPATDPRERSARSRRGSCTPWGRSSQAATTTPATRARAPTASTRSCRRAGGPGRERYLGDAYAKPTPANQEIVAAGQVRALYRGLEQLAPRRLLVADGSSRTTGWSAYATRYVNRVMAIYSNALDAPDAGDHRPDAPSLSRRRARAIDVQRARGGRRAIAGTPAAPRATRRTAGATATFTFTRRRGSSGTARSARPAARRGSASTARWCATVDLYRRCVRSPARRCSARAGRSTGKHTLVIEVVGTAGPPVRRDRPAGGRRLATSAQRPLARGDDLDLDPEVRGQGGHADRRPGRRLRREVLAIDRVHRREIGEVAQVDRALTTSR